MRRLRTVGLVTSHQASLVSIGNTLIVTIIVTVTTLLDVGMSVVVTLTRTNLERFVTAMNTVDIVTIQLDAVGLATKHVITHTGALHIILPDAKDIIVVTNTTAQVSAVYALYKIIP